MIRDDSVAVAPIDDRLMLAGSEYGSGYWLIRHLMNVWAANHDPRFSPGSNDSDQVEFTLDLVELGFLQWLAWNYPGHWDVDVFRTQSISGAGRRGQPALGAEPTPLKLSITGVPGEAGNLLLQHGFKPMTMGLPDSFAIPSGSTIEVSRSRGSRTITIKTAEAKIVVSFSAGGFGDLGATNMAEAIVHAWPDVTWKEYAVHATLTAEYSHLRRWSPRRTRQQRWIIALENGFRTDFDWALLKRDLLTTLRERPRI